MRLVLIFALSLTVLTQVANAKKPLPKEITTALSNLVDELIDCGVYYSIAHEELSRRKKAPQTVLDRYERSSKQMFGFAANSGREIGLRQLSLRARVKLSKQRQFETINGNVVNLTVLIEKFHKPCDAIGRDPGDRLRALTLEANPKLKKFR